MSLFQLSYSQMVKNRLTSDSSDTGRHLKYCIKVLEFGFPEIGDLNAGCKLYQQHCAKWIKTQRQKEV
ncbi:hypothetical protein E4U54_007428 [Claviceps lovelessii]|nr:hypothetical protein E4U54_007428 [Claviceps lovelessii]